MIAVSLDTSVSIIDAETMQTLKTYTDLLEQVSAPVWNPDGTQLAILNGNEVQIWSMPWDETNAELVSNFTTSQRYIYGADWNNGGDKFALGLGQLEVWDIATPKPQMIYSSDSHSMWQIAWNPTDSLIATTGSGDRVEVRDAATGQVTQTMYILTDSNLPASERFVGSVSVAWNPDGDKLVFGAFDGTIRIWDIIALDDGEVMLSRYSPSVINAHDESVYSVDWSSDGTKIASGSSDGTVGIWDADTLDEIAVIEVGVSTSVAWSPDGSKLVYRIEDGAIELWQDTSE